MGSLVDCALAILGFGVGCTRNVRSPLRLASGLSAVRTWTAEAQAARPTTAATGTNRAIRITSSSRLCPQAEAFCCRARVFALHVPVDGRHRPVRQVTALPSVQLLGSARVGLEVDRRVSKTVQKCREVGRPTTARTAACAYTASSA